MLTNAQTTEIVEEICVEFGLRRNECENCPLGEYCNIVWKLMRVNKVSAQELNEIEAICVDWRKNHDKPTEGGSIK